MITEWSSQFLVGSPAHKYSLLNYLYSVSDINIFVSFFFGGGGHKPGGPGKLHLLTPLWVALVIGL